MTCPSDRDTRRDDPVRVIASDTLAWLADDLHRLRYGIMHDAERKQLARRLRALAAYLAAEEKE